MRVYTQSFPVLRSELELKDLESLRAYYGKTFRAKLPSWHKVIRFVITKTDTETYHCELDVIGPEGDEERPNFLDNQSIFDFRKRNSENTDKFNAILLIPTGIGAEIGGHCGDGNSTARLLASACDTLITHPNVVNASDINEMTENTLYVEGSIITKLLMGKIGLQKVRSNRIAMLADKHEEEFFNNEIVNAVSSARVTLGIDCDVHEMKDIIQSVSSYSASGRAIGEIFALEKILKKIDECKSEYDAIALSTFIRVPTSFHKIYFEDEAMVNPWGGIEAMLTHSIAEIFGMPCAHSPMMSSSEVMDIELGVVDPRKAPESASITYLHCILKGLHKAPRVVGAHEGITLEDISCMVIPDGCIGLPTLACLENDIPVIAIKENKNNMRNKLEDLPFKKGKLFIVNNYWEAAGVMAAIKAGVAPESVRRPLKYTERKR
jgi:hypothetical protein